MKNQTLKGLFVFGSENLKSQHYCLFFKWCKVWKIIKNIWGKKVQNSNFYLKSSGTSIHSLFFFAQTALYKISYFPVYPCIYLAQTSASLRRWRSNHFPHHFASSSSSIFQNRIRQITHNSTNLISKTLQ